MFRTPPLTGVAVAGDRGAAGRGVPSRSHGGGGHGRDQTAGRPAAPAGLLREEGRPAAGSGDPPGPGPGFPGGGGGVPAWSGKPTVWRCHPATCCWGRDGPRPRPCRRGLMAAADRFDRGERRAAELEGAVREAVPGQALEYAELCDAGTMARSRNRRGGDGPGGRGPVSVPSASSTTCVWWARITGRGRTGGSGWIIRASCTERSEP